MRMICIAAIKLVFAEGISVWVICGAVIMLMIVEEVSVRRSYIGVCRGGVCVSDLYRRSYINICRGGICSNDFLYRNYIDVCRGDVFVRVICHTAVILVFAEGGLGEWSVVLNYIGIWKGGICVTDLWGCNYIEVGRRDLCMSIICAAAVLLIFERRCLLSNLWYRSYVGRNYVGRSYFDICKGGIAETDLYRHIYIGICGQDLNILILGYHNCQARIITL